MRGRSTDLREQRLARQIDVILAQEEALDRRRDELREREDRLARRERGFEQRRKEIELVWAKRTADLDERERAIGEAEVSLAARMKALEETVRKKARLLAEETVSLAERHRDVTRREQAVETLPSSVSVVSAPTEQSSAEDPDPGRAPGGAVGEDTEEIPVAPPVPEGGWNLNRIERLVEENAAAFPAKVDEWRYYLLYLREFAAINGVLPRLFDWLVWDAFGDLLAPSGGIPSRPAQPASTGA